MPNDKTNNKSLGNFLSELRPDHVQGVYFLASGLWPLLHYRSFEAVTGKKREPWLVKTVGLLVSAVGIGLLSPNPQNLFSDPVVSSLVPRF